MELVQGVREHTFWTELVWTGNMYKYASESGGCHTIRLPFLKSNILFSPALPNSITNTFCQSSIATPYDVER